VRILVETSGGGGIVLVAAVALLAGGHGGGLDAALAAAVIALAVVVALALGGLVALVLYRARRRGQDASRPPYAVRQLRADLVPPAVQTPDRPALEAPAVRLHPDQLAELAEILRQREQ
jgi:hypothetical protein